MYKRLPNVEHTSHCEFNDFQTLNWLATVRRISNVELTRLFENDFQPFNILAIVQELPNSHCYFNDFQTMNWPVIVISTAFKRWTD